ADCHGELRIAWMERFGTKPECQLAPQVNGIGRHHLCTSAFRQQRKDQPYGSLSQHCHDVARPQLQQLDPLEASINRFYPTCLIERNTIGNALNAALHNPIHHANILRESTAGRLISGRNTYPLINGALRIETPLTIKTVAARYMVKNYYAITRCVLVHAIAYGFYYSGCFMPINSGRRQQVIFNLFQISMTDATALDAHEHFAGADCRRFNSFY